MKIGFFGGTFDPPHSGHVRAASAFADQIRPDRLLIIPNYISPLKDKAVAPDEDRMRMCELAFSSVPGAEISDREIKAKGTSYTYRTVAALEREFRGAEIWMLLGSDSFMSLERWARWRALLCHCYIAVAMRGNEKPPLFIEKVRTYEMHYGARISLLHNEPVEVSSTEIRGHRSGLVPQAVAEYIREKGLYE